MITAIHSNDQNTARCGLAAVWPRSVFVAERCSGAEMAVTLDREERGSSG